MKLTQFFVALLALSFAAPASAQVRDHRRRKKPKQVTIVKHKFEVDGFSPASGPIGTTITIRGSGFTRRLKVLFGGRLIKPTSVNAKEIKITVPGRYGDGRIVLRKPNHADEIVAGTFRVVAPPRIRSFAPASGVAGTRVAIRGSAFEAGDRVLINGREIKIIKIKPSQIIAQIPNWATTDFLVVSRAGGGESTSGRKFSVLLPAPSITSLSPSGGPPGSIVRLTGQNIPPRARAFYGRVPLRIVSTGANWLEIEVPRNATRSLFFRIRGSTGEARSPQAFDIELPPMIIRFTPLFGLVGTQVEIFGENFRPGDVLSLNGRRLRIIQMRDNQITTRIPKRAISGSFVLSRGKRQVTSASTFEVDFAPIITRFTPPFGEPGTRITIQGNSFGRTAQVFYGGAKLRVLRRAGDTSLEVEVPRNATQNLPFVVRSRAGEATSAKNFRVHIYPTIRAIRPLAGAPGTEVTIKGRRLGRAGRFLLGGIEMPILSRGPKLVVVQVPADATSNVISWMSHGRKFEGRWRFNVFQPPTFRGFRPRVSAPGGRITIRGTNFAGRVRVFYGSTSLRVVRSTATEITVQLPIRGISGSDHLFVHSRGTRVQSGGKLGILSPPQITGFSPQAGKPGTEVSIRGNSFGKDAAVILDGKPVRIVRSSATELVIQIPANAVPGKTYFEVKNGGMKTDALRPFRILPTAVIAGFAPKRAKPGQKITIRGKGFAPGVRILFGATELKIVKIGRRGRKVEVIIPDNAKGTEHLVVDDSGIRSISSTTLQILSPPQHIRDHRKKKGKKIKGRVRDHRTK